MSIYIWRNGIMFQGWIFLQKADAREIAHLLHSKRSIPARASGTRRRELLKEAGLAEVIHGDFGFEGVYPERTVEGVEVPAIAALNLSPAPGDIEENLRLAGEAIAETKREQPALRWVVLPELFTCGYSELDLVHHHAEDAEWGRSAHFFLSLAQEHGIYIAYGFPERATLSAGVYDSANLVGPEGVIATYRKRSLVRTTLEHSVFTPGVDLPVVDAGGMRVALAICWDLGFPEVTREAVMGGADLILAPAAWRDPWGPQYDLSCAARALDSGVFLASANQLGTYPEACFDSPGHVYGPDGLRVSRSYGYRSVGVVDSLAIRQWRRTYGDTLSENSHVTSIGETPLEICS